MKRNIIKQANQAYTITLPIDWIRKNKLNAKSEVDILVNEKNILVSTSNPNESKKVSINVRDIDERIIRNYILSLYAKGIDEITIISEKDISAEITTALNNVMGFAMISQEKNKYVIKDLNAGTYQHLDEIFKRVFQMVILFYESAINDIFQEEKENIESLKTRDAEVNKFCLYLQRAINKSSYSDVIISRVVFTYSFALEKIGDEVERLWRTNIKHAPKKSKDLKALAELSKQGLEKAYDIFYQFSSTAIEELYSIREKVREKSLKINSKDANANRMIRHIVKIIEDATDLNHLGAMMKF